MNIGIKILIICLLSNYPLILLGQEIISSGSDDSYPRMGVIQYLDIKDYKSFKTIPITNTYRKLNMPDDLSMHINGNLYGVWGKYLYLLDTANSIQIIIKNFNNDPLLPSTLVGLCSDINGLLYLSALDGSVYKYDLNSQILTLLGSTNYTSPGDLEFINGKLYVAVWDHPDKYIVHFDTDLGVAIDTVFDEDVQNTYFAMSNNATPCSTTIFHLPNVGGNVLRIDFSQDTFKVIEVSDFEGSAGSTSSYSYYGSLPNMRIDTFQVKKESCDSQGRSYVEVNIPEARRAQAVYSLDGVNYQDSSVFRLVEEGEYVIHVVDSLGCYAMSDTFRVDQTHPTEFYWSPIPASCNRSDGEITLDSISGDTSGYEFSLDKVSWKDSPVFKGLSGNDHVVYARSPSGCLDSVIVEVTSNNELEVAYTHLNYCQKGKSDLLFDLKGAVNPLTIEYNNFMTQDTFIRNIADGTYKFSIEDNSGCTWTDTITITGYEGVEIISFQADSSECGRSNGRIEVNTASDTSVQYSLDTFDFQEGHVFSNLTAGIYALTAKDAYGCKDSIELKIAEKNTLSYTVQITPESCQRRNGSALFSFTGGESPYTVVQGNDTIVNELIQNLSSGHYEFKMFDNNGCFLIDTFSIPHINGPKITTVDVINTECDQPSGAIYVQGEFDQYKISGKPYQAGGHFNNLSAGVYDVIVRDSLGCTDSLKVSIEARHDIIKSDTICGASYTDTIHISQGICDTFLIKKYIKKPAVRIIDSVVTCNKDYSGEIIQITGRDGCDTIFEEVVSYYDAYLNIEAPNSVEAGESVLLTVNTNMSGISIIRWIPESGLNNPNLLEPIVDIAGISEYKLHIEDDYGCKLETTFDIGIREGADLIYVPNIFTPNGDGINDEFRAVTASASIELENMKIFDRWGTLIFESGGNIPWDGSYKGSIVSEGVYTFLIEYKYGEKVSNKAGTITLKRD